MAGENINSLSIRNEILNILNSEKTMKTINNILNEKGINNPQRGLYDLYEKEAERLFRNSFLIEKYGQLYVISRKDEDKYYLKKAGMMDRIMNFLNNF